MGVSDPLSDEYDALRGAVLSPDRSSPPSSFRATDDDYLQHQVSRMDTLAGIAIKYAVEVTRRPPYFLFEPANHPSSPESLVPCLAAQFIFYKPPAQLRFPFYFS
jgi:hypothetical protein